MQKLRITISIVNFKACRRQGGPKFRLFISDPTFSGQDGYGADEQESQHGDWSDMISRL